MRQFLDDGGVEFRPAVGDARIRAEILSRLAHSPWLDSRGVDVRVSGGDVRLEGRVPERQTARAIKEIAARCDGVRGIDERLRVARPRDRTL